MDFWDRIKLLIDREKAGLPAFPEPAKVTYEGATGNICAFSGGIAARLVLMAQSVGTMASWARRPFNFNYAWRARHLALLTY